ncbi:hypothetical protein LG3211_1788 [Lysobacter gummosus]|nr:hypothetical protein LG3211_1788 [Lysobacter gummosus]
MHAVSRTKERFGAPLFFCVARFKTSELRAIHKHDVSMPKHAR